MMVEREFPDHKLTELELGKRLRELRLADDSCVDESFAPIIGWNGNGALAHYEATEETNATLDSDGILLVDSGGQYIYGTTDITRTVASEPPRPSRNATSPSPRKAPSHWRIKFPT